MKRILSAIAGLCLIAIILPSHVVSATEVATANSEVLPEEVDAIVDAEPFDFSRPIRVGYYSTFEDIITDIESINNKG